MMMLKRLFVVLSLVLVPLISTARAEELIARRLDDQAFAVPLTRFILPNGLVVLLSPEPNAASVVVHMRFRAGAAYEPANRTGLAHLVEHIVSSGLTPDTDYEGMLLRHHARDFNAHTDADSMRFEVELPAEELPLALWTNADRLGTLAHRIDDALVRKHIPVVQQERTMRVVDQPYGAAHALTFARMYQSTDPLHGAVIGVSADVSRASAAEVNAFVSRYLVPANALLVVVGRFDPDTARALIERDFASLPAGERAPIPRLRPAPEPGVQFTAKERISRSPAVNMVWRLPALSTDSSTALALGSEMLQINADGIFGIGVDASTSWSESETVFWMSTILPYDETPEAALADAQSLLRQVTVVESGADVLQWTQVLLDRDQIFKIDSLQARADDLEDLERRSQSRISIVDWVHERWAMDRYVVRDTMKVLLMKNEPSAITHARPINPRQPKVVPTKPWGEETAGEP